MKSNFVKKSSNDQTTISHTFKANLNNCLRTQTLYAGITRNQDHLFESYNPQHHHSKHQREPQHCHKTRTYSKEPEGQSNKSIQKTNPKTPRKNSSLQTPPHFTSHGSPL